MAIHLYSAEEFAGVAAAAGLAERVQRAGAEMMARGLSVDVIDRELAGVAERAGGASAYADYQGFPNRCGILSVNSEVCNAVARVRQVVDGDVVSISAAVKLGGMFAKSEDAYCVGGVSAVARRLVDTTYEGLRLGLAAVKPGARIGDVSAAIEGAALRAGLGVVESYCGHGIGITLHAPPQIPCVGRAGTGTRIRPGMALYVMAMFTTGAGAVRIEPDGWTAVTADGSLSANAARTVLVEAGGARVVPAEDSGPTPTALSLQASPAKPWYVRLLSRARS